MTVFLMALQSQRKPIILAYAENAHTRTCAGLIPEGCSEYSIEEDVAVTYRVAEPGYARDVMSSAQPYTDVKIWHIADRCVIALGEKERLAPLTRTALRIENLRWLCGGVRARERLCG
jgi:hypothetical protein